VKILVVDDGVFTGDKLQTGRYYVCEPLESGTLAQSKAFHALLQEYYISNCHSYNVKSFDMFREVIKRDLGVGFDSYVFVAQTRNGPLRGEAKNRNEIPECVKDAYGKPLLWGKLKSWADYTKKERRLTIDRLISEMEMNGVDTPHYREILKGMEGIWDDKKREKEHLTVGGL
jgi:hypothetical protein